jgi:hypothetical protein
VAEIYQCAGCGLILFNSNDLLAYNLGVSDFELAFILPKNLLESSETVRIRTSV